MNLLYITHDINLSGASRSLLEIMEYLEHQDNKVYVLVATRKGDFYQELLKHNCEIICMPYFLWRVPKTSWWKWLIKRVRWYLLGQIVNCYVTSKLAKIVKDKEIQIIHTNTGVCNIGALLHKETQIPHIWHIREFADLDFNMYPLSSNKYYQALMKGNTTLFLFNSFAVKNHYEFLKESKSKVIYNGISDQYIICDNEKPDHDVINFLISGRLSESKGQTQAIKACQILINEGIKNFKLFLAGQGMVEYEHSDALDKHLEFLGVQNDMRKVRQNMDVELVCSCAEAFGRVTVEAMFAGMPVIGSNVGGTIEIIQDGRNGYLYELGDINDLAGKMKKLILFPNVRKHMGSYAREYAYNKFCLKNCVTQIEVAYEEVILKQ